MPARVADASVLAALMFLEPEAEEALSLVEGMDLIEPGLLAYELTSVARKKIRARPSARDELIGALRRGLRLPFRWLDVEHLAVLRLALDTGLTTYDATYLYLARSLDIPLLTFDADLAAATAM